MENKRLIKNWKKSISNFPFYIKFIVELEETVKQFK